MSGAGDLDDFVRRVDPDRWLSSRFVTDPVAREDVVALYAFDHELARAGRVASNPLIAEMRLVWWREVLDEIVEARPVRKHPTAQALADAVARRGIARSPLDDMVEGRIEALDGDVAGVERAGAGVALAAAFVLTHSSRASLPNSREDDSNTIAELGAIWARIAYSRDGEPEPQIGDRFRRARGPSRRLPASTLPAVLHLALAAPELSGRRPSGLEAQLRLIWASLTGRL